MVFRTVLFIELSAGRIIYIDSKLDGRTRRTVMTDGDTGAVLSRISNFFTNETGNQYEIVVARGDEYGQQQNTSDCGIFAMAHGYYKLHSAMPSNLEDAIGGFRQYVEECFSSEKDNRRLPRWNCVTHMMDGW
jgi:hypothetical protein